MKYFSRAWAQGELSDAEHSAIARSYERYLDGVLSGLPASVAALARDVPLHDALIRQVVANYDAGSLKLDLLCGDLQGGYVDIGLTYGKVDWSPLDMEALARRAADPETELLFDEIERLSEEVFEHRVLLWPDDEVAIRFAELAIERVPRSDRVMDREEQRFLMLGEPA